MTFRAIDLFSGAGGLSRGLIEAGFEVTAAFETWAPALSSYRANFRHPSFDLDVSVLDTATFMRLGIEPEPDLVAGGPPCQGFSIQRIGDDADDRNDLVLAFGRAVIALNARSFIMENVPGIMGGRGKAVVSRFLSQMRTAGCEGVDSVLDAADYGVPQFRRRVFFVGWKSDALGSFRFPAALGDARVTVRAALKDLDPPPTDYSPAKGDPLHRRTRLSRLNQLRLSKVPPGGGFEDLPVELRATCHKEGAERIGHRSVYGRLHPDRPANTITGRFDSFTRGRFAHPLEDRNITLREGARLQGFPDDHVFLGTQEEIAAQIGNAVPPPLAGAVASALVAAWQSERSNRRSWIDLEGLPLFASGAVLS